MSIPKVCPASEAPAYPGNIRQIQHVATGLAATVLCTDLQQIADLRRERRAERR